MCWIWSWVILYFIFKSMLFQKSTKGSPLPSLPEKRETEETFFLFTISQIWCQRKSDLRHYTSYQSGELKALSEGSKKRIPTINFISTLRVPRWARFVANGKPTEVPTPWVSALITRRLCSRIITAQPYISTAFSYRVNGLIQFQR